MQKFSAGLTPNARATYHALARVLSIFIMKSQSSTMIDEKLDDYGQVKDRCVSGTERHSA
jgi:hypothetical protein